MKLSEAERILKSKGFIKDTGRMKHLVYRRGKEIMSLPNHPGVELKPHYKRQIDKF